MEVAIHSSALGSRQHLIYSKGEFKFATSYSDETWTIGDKFSNRLLEEVSELFDDPLPQICDSLHAAAFKSLNLDAGQAIPWHFVLSKEDLNDRVKRLLTTSQALLQRLQDSKYLDLFLQHKRFLKSIERMSIDRDRYDAHLSSIDDGTSKISNLKSFLPDDEGLAQKIVFTQAATVTGRLTVAEGPKILTLPAEFRDIITSEHQGGRVYSIDFVSLEPRVIKSIVSTDAIPEDIYEHVQSLIGDARLSRAEVKKLIISCIYGASKTRLQEMSKSGNVSHISRIINDYFSLEQLNQKLDECHRRNGHIINFFGRPIIDDKSESHTWLSHYAQSTAVDVALDAFYHLSNLLRVEDKKIVPIGVIHDAVLFDVPPASDSFFKNLTDQKIQTLLGPFPVSRTEITRRNNV